jgi:hypothetical protein
VMALEVWRGMITDVMSSPGSRKNGMSAVTLRLPQRCGLRRLP